MLDQESASLEEITNILSSRIALDHDTGFPTYVIRQGNRKYIDALLDHKMVTYDEWNHLYDILNEEMDKYDTQ